LDLIEDQDLREKL